MNYMFCKIEIFHSVIMNLEYSFQLDIIVVVLAVLGVFVLHRLVQLFFANIKKLLQLVIHTPGALHRNILNLDSSTTLLLPSPHRVIS